jgi:hypothetical protein
VEDVIVAFGVNDRREVEGLLSKLTTTVDAIGRSKRDVELVIKINTHWPASVVNALGAFSTSFQGMLSAAEVLEDSVVNAINTELPPS